MNRLIRALRDDCESDACRDGDRWSLGGLIALFGFLALINFAFCMRDY